MHHIAIAIVFTLVVLTLLSIQGRVTPAETPAAAAGDDQAAEQDNPPIPVDGIRYVSHVDALAQPDSDQILLLARCVNRSVYRASISRATAIAIRDRLSKAIDAQAIDAQAIGAQAIGAQAIGAQAIGAGVAADAAPATGAPAT